MNFPSGRQQTYLDDRYEDQDNVHYEGFRYKDSNGKLQTFVPNSDMSFSDFRKLMKDEWAKMSAEGAGQH